jgi:hypothetical protein
MLSHELHSARIVFELTKQTKLFNYFNSPCQVMLNKIYFNLSCSNPRDLFKIRYPSIVAAILSNRKFPNKFSSPKLTRSLSGLKLTIRKYLMKIFNPGLYPRSLLKTSNQSLMPHQTRKSKRNLSKI